MCMYVCLKFKMECTAELGGYEDRGGATEVLRGCWEVSYLVFGMSYKMV